MNESFIRICIFLAITTAPFFFSASIKAQSFDYCSLSGTVFIDEKYPEEADFIVHIEESEAFAELKVFREDNSLFADRDGIWFFTETRDFSDFIIYLTEDKDQADFSIYYTDIPSFAGCN